MHKKLILLIDDSPLIIRRIHILLQEVEGIRDIQSADSYEAAIQLLSAVTPDLVVLDINLGGRSGIDLLQYIRKYYPAVTVIMLSNQDSRLYRGICRELGAAHFIDKSIEFGRLRPIIADYCRQSG